jgi:acetylornithine deacetylase/succinyl-diaminopimelate desuccinylase-like protein
MVKETIQGILKNEQVILAMDFLKADDEATLKEQLELVQIPSPTFSEAERRASLVERIKTYGICDIEVDGAGNLVATRKGTGNGPNIVISSHMDTVFDMDTDYTIKQEGNIYHVPGICDATRSLAELLSIVRALEHAEIKTVGNLIFCMTVGEEAKGNLFGSRHFFKTRDDIDAFITVDTSMAHGIVYLAQGGASYRMTFTGKGGHGFLDYGISNANNALGRAIAKISDMKPDQDSHTTFNVGIIEGGDSPNGISKKAVMTLSLRSDNEESLNNVEQMALKLIDEAVEAENQRWQSPHPVKVDVELLSRRPSGTQPVDSPIVKILQEATAALDLEVILASSAATDANIPINLGVPGVAIGHGGIGGNIHSIDEWFSPVDSYLGPQRALLAVLAMTGIAGFRDPIQLRIEG